MKIVTTIDCLEADGKAVEYKAGEEIPYVKVHAHWNKDEWIVLEMWDGDTYTVKASDLERAIKNAKGWRWG